MRFSSSTSRRLSLAAAALFTAILGAQARADSYSLTIVDHTQSENFYGIDSIGDFTVNLNNNPLHAGPGSTCGSVSNSFTCYETFYVGNSTPVFSVAPPSLTWDNGSSSCGIDLGASFNVVRSLCNGDHFLVNAYHTTGNSMTRGIWAGPSPDPTTDFISSGSIDGGFINSLGDAVYIDGLNDTLVFADDLTTNALTSVPEPATLALLGTGTLTLLGAARRRLPL